MSAFNKAIVTSVTSKEVDNSISQFTLTAHVEYSEARGRIRQDLTVEALSVKGLDCLPIGASVHIVIPTWKGIGKKLWTKEVHGWLEHPLIRNFKDVNIILTN